jgi:hypothetical protein
MAYTVVLHLTSEEPVAGEVEELPDKADLLITVTNPRRLDGKDLQYLTENVITVMYPINRINFIEVLPSREEEKIIGFVRE